MEGGRAVAPWLRLAVAGRPFTWMDVDRIAGTAELAEEVLHTSTASQLIRTGLLRPVKMARLVMDLRTRKKRWSTSSYRGTAKARRLFGEVMSTRANSPRDRFAGQHPGQRMGRFPAG